jgi:hypothetical protein
MVRPSLLLIQNYMPLLKKGMKKSRNKLAEKSQVQGGVCRSPWDSFLIFLSNKNVLQIFAGFVSVCTAIQLSILSFQCLDN